MNRNAESPCVVARSLSAAAGGERAVDAYSAMKADVSVVCTSTTGCCAVELTFCSVTTMAACEPPINKATIASGANMLNLRLVLRRTDVER